MTFLAPGKRSTEQLNSDWEVLVWVHKRPRANHDGTATRTRRNNRFSAAERKDNTACLFLILHISQPPIAKRRELNKFCVVWERKPRRLDRQLPIIWRKNRKQGLTTQTYYKHLFVIRLHVNDKSITKITSAYFQGCSFGRNGWNKMLTTVSIFMGPGYQ